MSCLQEEDLRKPGAMLQIMLTTRNCYGVPTSTTSSPANPLLAKSQSGTKALLSAADGGEMEYRQCLKSELSGEIRP